MPRILQSPSPKAGLVFATRLYATSSANPQDESKGDVTVVLPANIRLNRTFHQTDGFANSGGGATSNLSIGDVPAGLYFVCGGSDTNGKRWILTGIQFDADDQVTQWAVTLGLYADTGTAFGQGGSNVDVDVFYMPKP
jgi:hypothetical protein